MTLSCLKKTKLKIYCNFFILCANPSPPPFVLTSPMNSSKLSKLKNNGRNISSIFESKPYETALNTCWNNCQQMHYSPSERKGTYFTLHKSMGNTVKKNQVQAANLLKRSLLNIVVDKKVFLWHQMANKLKRYFPKGVSYCHWLSFSFKGRW